MQAKASTLTNTAVTVQWTAPADDGGSAIIDYNIRRYDAAGVSQEDFTISAGATLEKAFTGLT